MTVESYNTLITRERGGEVLRVKSGGSVIFDSGSQLLVGSADLIAELAILDGITAGTVTAGKFVAVDSNKDISEFRNVGLAGTLTFGAGGQINADSGTATCTTNAATLNKMAGVITTESLSTAAGATQDITITNSLVTASDLVFVEVCGGTNTKACIKQKTVSGSGSFVVTLRNIEASDALDGTVIFNFLVVKA